MPRGDGTGPQGQGPMTGRKMGRCSEGRNTSWPGSRSTNIPPDVPGGRGNSSGTGKNTTGRGSGQGRTGR